VRPCITVQDQQKGIRVTHLHWMPLYIGDELAETSHLTAEEFGAYISLKMHYWQHGGLPVEDRRLERIARCTAAQWETIKPTLMELFFEGWKLPRLEEQRAQAEETHIKRSEAGRRGGRPRKDEKAGNKPGFSPEKAGPKQPQPQPQPHPYSDSQRQPKPHHPAYEGREDDGNERRESMFDAFPRPASAAAAREFLSSKGVPQGRLDDCVRRMMGDNFSPFDLEGVLEEARNAA